MVKYLDWDEKKNTRLRNERGISFEEIVLAIASGQLLDDLAHPNRRLYPNQRVFVVQVGEVVFAVPYVEDDERIFMKTVYPSRKLSRRYLGGGQ